jgi:hypothetical protein
MNNLLERLHASFFFYLLPHPGWFHKIGAYLPAAILLGAGMTFRGLGLWVDAGWEAVKIGSSQAIQWRRRDRQVHIAAFIIASCLSVSWFVYRLRRYIATVGAQKKMKMRYIPTNATSSRLRPTVWQDRLGTLVRQSRCSPHWRLLEP